MKHLLPLLFTTLMTTQAIALSVTVQVTPQKCTLPGTCKAVVNNAVAPLTYEWSNGGATQTISVDAGTYTVTVTDATGEQATATGTVAYQDNYGSLSLPYDPDKGYCPDEGMFLGYPFFRWNGTMNAPIGPPPYYFNGDEVHIQDDDYPWGGSGLYYVWITMPEGSMPAPPGSYQQMEFMDGTGCAGTFSITAGYPVEWPYVEVVQVNGACNGQNNGSVTVQVDAEPHHIQVAGLLINSDGQVVDEGLDHWHGTSAMQDTYSGLAPGMYSIVHKMTADPYSFLYQACDNTALTFTIPDLGATCNTVSGEVYVDVNKDCVKGSASAEPRVPGTIIEFLPGPVYAVTDHSGAYSINLPNGSYTASHNAGNLSQHCPPPPASFTVGSGPVALDFGDTSLVPMDALVTLNSSPARPGFGMNWWITAKNTTPATTGEITVEFEFDPVLEYVSATPAPTSIDGTTITWSGPPLAPFGLRTFHVEFEIPADVDLLGTVLSGSASLATAQTDADPDNNTAGRNVIITGSFDPNDKLGYTDRTNSTETFALDRDEWLEYTIRFQNTGTDTAFTVVVSDELSGDLDIRTLDIIGASHAYEASFGEGRELLFTFDDILLPDSTTDLLGSNGFVSYRIKPRPDISIGDVLENTASIYFDFNPPVVTNTMQHEVVPPGVQLEVHAFLGGAYDMGEGLMGDALRSLGLLPTREPYTGLGYVHQGDGGGETAGPARLAVAGPGAIVDWVVVELRDATDPSTVLHSVSGLLQRDGLVVGGDGGALWITAPAGSYHVALRHRNHLGVMTASPVSLDLEPTTIDLTGAGTATWGTDARMTVGSIRALWPGDITLDGAVKYTGATNDRDRILQDIGGALPNAVQTGYHGSDVNLDGTIQYTGTGNDRDMILLIIGGEVPTRVIQQQLPE